MSELKTAVRSFSAFSGLPSHINKPSSQCLNSTGPIPKGFYYIFDRQSGGRLDVIRDIFTGRDEWFALYAVDSKIDDETYCDYVKRGQFRLHPRGPGNISQGCITIDKRNDFQIIRSLLKGTKTGKVPGLNLDCYGKIRVY